MAPTTPPVPLVYGHIPTPDCTAGRCRQCAMDALRALTLARFGWPIAQLPPGAPLFCPVCEIDVRTHPEGATLTGTVLGPQTEVEISCGCGAVFEVLARTLGL